jgi:hypothetical protein
VSAPFSRGKKRNTKNNVTSERMVPNPRNESRVGNLDGQRNTENGFPISETLIRRQRHLFGIEAIE